MRNGAKSVILPREAEAVSKIQNKADSGWGDNGWALTANDFKESMGGKYDKNGVKCVVHEFEAAISKSEKEILVVLDEHGQFVEARGDKTGSVNIDGLNLKATIATHNHPSGICTLSYGDMEGFMDGGVYESRCVTSDGRFAGLRRGKGKIQENEFIKARDHALGDDKELYRTVASYLDKIIGDGKWDRTDVVKEMERQVNEWLVDNAKIYGYIFERGLL